MPTDIERLSDEDLLDEYGAVSWRAEPEEGPYQEQLYKELLNRMSGAGWRDVEEEGDPPTGVLSQYEVVIDEDLDGNYRFDVCHWIGDHWHTPEKIIHWRPIPPLPNPPEEG